MLHTSQCPAVNHGIQEYNINMSYEYKLKLILFANHIALAIGLVYADLSWLALSFLGWIVFGKIGGEIALHRYLCHKSFKTDTLRHNLLIILSIFNCFGSPIAWCGIHRKHHAKSVVKIYDFIDDFRYKTEDHDWLNYIYRHGMARRKIYKEEKFPFEVQNIRF